MIFTGYANSGKKYFIRIPYIFDQLIQVAKAIIIFENIYERI